MRGLGMPVPYDPDRCKCPTGWGQDESSLLNNAMSPALLTANDAPQVRLPAWALRANNQAAARIAVFFLSHTHGMALSH